MKKVSPRLEFRAFGGGFWAVEQAMRRHALCEAIDETREIYVIGRELTERNLKIRGGRLELKTLVERDGELERWRPVGRWSFPLASGDLDRLLGTSDASGRFGNPPQSLSRDEFLTLVTRSGGGLARANVFKRRFHFTIGDCATEVDELTVNGAAIQSVAVESADAGAVRDVCDLLGLQGCDNVSYPLALARILGLVPLPGEQDYGHGN